jgi:energy-coupling factor transporter ATP-binding protein EcfA2
MKELLLLRGCSGSGKSTLAKSLGGVHYEADMFFVEDGEYRFDG